MKHHMPLFPNAPSPLLFGHRGSPRLAPENTLPSFELCRAPGIDGIELDVHLCATGELVVTHDENTLRVSGFDGIVEQMSYDQIRELDAGANFSGRAYQPLRMPLLSEVFESFGTDLYYDIELKTDRYRDTGLAAAVYRMIKHHGIEQHAVVSSFNPFPVRYFRRHAGDSIPAAVIYCVCDEQPKFLQRGFGRHLAGCRVLKPEHIQITSERFSHDSGKRGYAVLTWTVDDADEAVRLCDLGVDGLITNEPGIMKDVIAAYR